MSLLNKVALVTGASSGIGLATARLFAKEGAIVAATGRNKNALDTLVNEIQQTGGKAKAFPGDVCNDEDVKKVVNDAVKEFGGLHVLVNNAGVPSISNSIEETTEAEFDNLFAVNTKGLFFVTQAALKYIPKGGPDGMDELWADPESTLTKWKTPLIEDEEIIELPVDQRTITRRYTQKAIDFITENKAKPFFVYLPHSMPHIPLYVPDDVRNPDPLYAYINTIEHIDSEVGRLLKRLDDLKLAENTYVLYTTDNGPWLRFKHHGGTAGPLRDGKGTTFEGGQRVPCVLRGPGIPAGSVCHELTGTIDVLPTLAALIGGALPSQHRIDGLDMSALWEGKKEAAPRKEFLYYSSHGVLEGIRQGPWKLLVKSPRKGKNAGKTKEPEILLFNLEEDLGEKENLAGKFPEEVAKLQKKMEDLDAEITSNARPPWFEDDESDK